MKFSTNLLSVPLKKSLQPIITSQYNWPIRSVRACLMALTTSSLSITAVVMVSVVLNIKYLLFRLQHVHSISEHCFLICIFVSVCMLELVMSCLVHQSEFSKTKKRKIESAQDDGS